MVVRVVEIPEDGLRIEGAEAFDRPFQDGTWKLANVSLLVEKDGDAVFVRGHLSARVPQLCGRCLEGYAVTVEPRIDARFVPGPRGRTEEHELAADDLETDVYDNGVLDLNSLLETETSLALPMKPLCRESCRGLCSVCGGNRNVTECSCEEHAPDARWAPLKAWAARQSSQPVQTDRQPRKIDPEHPHSSTERTGSEADHAVAQETPLEDPRPQATHPLQDGGTDPLVVPTVPRDQAPSPRLPPLRLLQRTRSHLGRGRVGPTETDSWGDAHGSTSPGAVHEDRRRRDGRRFRSRCRGRGRGGGLARVGAGVGAGR